MPTQINASVIKAFAILRLFSDARGEITAAAVSAELGLNPVTAHRFLKTLESIGALVAVAKGVYRLGFMFVDLGDRVMGYRALASALQPVLDRVTADLREASMATSFEADMAVCIARAYSDRSLSVDIRVGSRLEAYCTSHGKVWLASLSQAALERYFDVVPLEPLSPNTVTDRDELLRQIEAARRDGFATNDGEREAGIRTIAVPLTARDGRMIAGLSVFGPLPRMTDAVMDQALARLRRAVEDAHAALYGGPS